MIFHDHRSLSCLLVKYSPEINLGRCESDSANSKATQDIELDWQDLVGPSDFNRDSHCELFELVSWRVFILLYQVLFTSAQNASVRPEL